MNHHFSFGHTNTCEHQMSARRSPANKNNQKSAPDESQPALSYCQWPVKIRQIERSADQSGSRFLLKGRYPAVKSSFTCGSSMNPESSECKAAAARLSSLPSTETTLTLVKVLFVSQRLQRFWAQPHVGFWICLLLQSLINCHLRIRKQPPCRVKTNFSLIIIPLPLVSAQTQWVHLPALSLLF